MGLKDRISLQKPKQESNKLTKKELEVLLNMVKNSTFKGADIEPIYNLVIKLQDQYTN
mgnify:FL=1|jgi:hypothetical protein|tara:strand:+ start:770 stop:943 length:174 start_codon:yes stop_codon:yes gene_type:complete